MAASIVADTSYQNSLGCDNLRQRRPITGTRPGTPIGKDPLISSGRGGDRIARTWRLEASTTRSSPSRWTDADIGARSIFPSTPFFESYRLFIARATLQARLDSGLQGRRGQARVPSKFESFT